MIFLVYLSASAKPDRFVQAAPASTLSGVETHLATTLKMPLSQHETVLHYHRSQPDSHRQECQIAHCRHTRTAGTNVKNKIKANAPLNARSQRHMYIHWQLAIDDSGGWHKS